MALLGTQRSLTLAHAGTRVTRINIGRLGAGLAFAAGALLLVACSSSSADAPPTPSPTSSFTPPPTATRPSTPAPPPAAQSDSPVRWGYDPSKPTGLHDAPTEFAGLPSGYRIETVVTGLQRPTAMAFTPDGRLLVAEQAGAVRVVQDGQLDSLPFYQANVFLPGNDNAIVELGLVGITVDPQFQYNRLVYIYYTTDEPERRTVLARLVDVGGRGTSLEELLSLDAAPRCCHIAGSLRFAPDDTLFVAVGDHQMEDESQNRQSPFGAILRIRRDGRVPSDNPFVGVAGSDPRIYAYGLRNPYDIAIDPESGRIFATENGFQGQDAVIEVKPGANYGWPGSDLSVPLDQIEPPLLFYHDAIGPAGMEFYQSNALPALTGSLLFCQFHQGGALHAIRFAPDGSVASDTIIARACTSDVVTGPDGLIYFVDYVQGAVFRIVSDEAAQP